MAPTAEALATTLALEDPPATPGPAAIIRGIILDIDGVIANISEPVTREDADWKYKTAPPIFININFALRLANSFGAQIWIVTAREDRHRKTTHEWLTANRLGHYSRLYMRKNWNASGSVGFKRSVIRQILSCSNIEIICALDDRDDILGMYLSEFGIAALKPPGQHLGWHFDHHHRQETDEKVR